MNIEFIETSIFTRNVYSLLTEDEYSKLQDELGENPEKGKLIRGGKGIRKIRVAYSDKSKRNGARAIYYFKKNDHQIYMLLIYPKSEQENLTPAQLDTLAKLVERTLK